MYTANWIVTGRYFISTLFIQHRKNVRNLNQKFERILNLYFRFHDSLAVWSFIMASLTNVIYLWLCMDNSLCLIISIFCGMYPNEAHMGSLGFCRNKAIIRTPKCQQICCISPWVVKFSHLKVSNRKDIKTGTRQGMYMALKIRYY